MRWTEIITEELAIDEAFDKGAPVHWDFKSDIIWNGTFQVGEHRYSIDIAVEEGYNIDPESDEAGKVWDLEFSAITGDAKFRNSGKLGQDGLKVFSSVIQAVIGFVKEAQPERLKFTGSKGERRDGLYERILKNFGGQIAALGYKWKAHNRANIVIFMVEKNS